jgi:Fe-S-cluster-containing dehydrogenase component/formate-dependent nitrite reductase membrane component NrfD
VQYGFAIDQRTCIGCHACTVACKTEHEVPLGQFRTWVKYVDSGEYPDTSRAFGVMRCNHCTDAPCVAICPTKALFKRDDGIVDFDRDRCIGCKSCMQGCPYDAIYIDEDTHTAAKCNFCAHRVDAGMEPACVVVCPTHSIWVGDLDNPESGISQLIAANETMVRAPEQGTGPNTVYIGASIAVLDPLAAPVDDSYIWARPDEQRLAMAADAAGYAGYGNSHAGANGHDGATLAGPLGTLSTTDNAHTTLNTAHPRPWGWRVWTYLWTKSVGAGALLVLAIGMVLGLRFGTLGDVVAPAVAVAFAGITGVLLVWDLKRPERFHYILLKPNPRSWLMWGAWALMAFSGVAAVWLLLGSLGVANVIEPRSAFDVLRWVAIPTAALAAGYTAFLFGQAEGRDLWQSPLLLPDLLAQAAMAGAGVLLVAAAFFDLGPQRVAFLVRTLVVASVVHLVLLGVEYFGHHRSRGASVAARIASRGRYATPFWAGAVAPVAVAVVLASVEWSAANASTLAVVAGLLVQPALLVYESVFIRAGQDVPLS